MSICGETLQGSCCKVGLAVHCVKFELLSVIHLVYAGLSIFYETVTRT